jgi:hypothetical protein
MSMFDILCEGKSEHTVVLLYPYPPSFLVYGSAGDGLAKLLQSLVVS